MDAEDSVKEQSVKITYAAPKNGKEDSLLDLESLENDEPDFAKNHQKSSNSKKSRLLSAKEKMDQNIDEKEFNLNMNSLRDSKIEDLVKQNNSRHNF